MQIILNVGLILIAIVIFITLGIKEQKDDENKEVDFQFNKKQWLAIIPIIILLFTLVIKFVPANTVGVKWSIFGGTSQETLDEGIVLITPFDKIYLIPTTVQERTIENVQVQTKDSQVVTMEVNVKFSVQKKDAFKVYKRYGTMDALTQNIISNFSQKSIEKVVTQYNVIEALGEKKTEIYLKAEKDLKERLEKEGVILEELTIKDMDAGAEIEKAISDEAVAKKEVETAEQKRLKAEKDAQTKIIEAQGQADANAILTEQLTDAVLQKMFIETWDGKLPLVSSDSGNMIDISALLNTQKEK